MFLMLCGVRECFSRCIECGSVSHAVWSEGVLLMLYGMWECFSCCVECGKECFARCVDIGVFLHAVWSAGGGAFHVVLLNL